jgi:hypothetical protein
MIYLLVFAEVPSAVLNHDEIVLEPETPLAAILCQMNALKRFSPTPSRFFNCSLLSYAFYDRELQTAKNPQQIKTELHNLHAEWSLALGASVICPQNPREVQTNYDFFPAQTCRGCRLQVAYA